MNAHEPWWCADCAWTVTLDEHGRCENCGSDAIDANEPPRRLNEVEYEWT